MRVAAIVVGGGAPLRLLFRIIDHGGAARDGRVVILGLGASRHVLRARLRTLGAACWPGAATVRRVPRPFFVVAAGAAAATGAGTSSRFSRGRGSTTGAVDPGAAWRVARSRFAAFAFVLRRRGLRVPPRAAYRRASGAIAHARAMPRAESRQNRLRRRACWLPCVSLNERISYWPARRNASAFTPPAAPPSARPVAPRASRRRGGFPRR